ncbi:hypothetical protein TorRG33x02_259660, partial [Trema orientale]
MRTSAEALVFVNLIQLSLSSSSTCKNSANAIVGLASLSASSLMWPNRMALDLKWRFTRRASGGCLGCQSRQSQIACAA